MPGDGEVSTDIQLVQEVVSVAEQAPVEVLPVASARISAVQ